MARAPDSPPGARYCRKEPIGERSSRPTAAALPSSRDRSFAVAGRSWRTAQSFCVPTADIAAQGYDLSINRYRELAQEDLTHRAPTEILAELARLEDEMHRDLAELTAMLR